MNVSERALTLIKHHEGVRYKPYRCPAKLWTVGVGHVMYPEQAKLPIAERDNFSLSIRDFRTFGKDEVDEILMADLRRFEIGRAHV